MMIKQKMRDFEKLNLQGKYVLLRDDLNVPIVDGHILDAHRIESSKKTIDKLVNMGARVVICSHLGRPKGKYDLSYSLNIVAQYMHVHFVSDCLAKNFLKDMRDGDVVLLENLRFHKGEETNNNYFAKKLAEGFDIYINDAFAVSHRSAASVVGITKYLPSYAGCLLMSEIKNISSILECPKKPILAFVGGSKISTKIGVLKFLVKFADKLVIGGALGTTFNFVKGLPVGNSLYEANVEKDVNNIIKLAKTNNCEIFLPLDKGVAKFFSKDAPRLDKPVLDILPDDIIMDDGKQTISRNNCLLSDAKTVIWNGTFGMAEWGSPWDKSSVALAKSLSNYTKDNTLISIVGGGDTVALLDHCNVYHDLSYVSTGGGAFLEFIEGKSLPGIKVLE